MASTHKHIRSSTANKRPTTAIADGQIALNTNSTSPGLFFKDSTGATIIKVGPVHVGATAPNISPAAGGSSGNSTGEVWLDTSLTPNGVKIWNGSSWTNATPIGSTTVQGLLELATDAETQAGSDVSRAVTPASLQSKISDSVSTASGTLIASSTAVKTAYDLANAAVPKAGGTIIGPVVISPSGSLSFEGSTDDGFETTLSVIDPTADRTIFLPNASGVLITTGDIGSITGTMIASGTITNTNVSPTAAIEYSKLANITAGSILLGNASNIPTVTAVTGDVTINSSGVTAIAADSIVNGDISPSAEIAVSKLANGTARQLIQTDAAGTGVEWASNIDIPGTLDVTGTATFDSAIQAVGGLVGAIRATVSSGNSSFKVPFLNTTGTVTAEYNLLHDSSATFTYNPSTDTLTCTTFSGALSGNATTATSATSATSATTATNANNVNLAAGTAATNYITFGEAATGNTALKTDTGLVYNASTNVLTTSVSGNATTATTLQTARTINGSSFNGSANITIPASLTAGASTTNYVVFGEAATGNVSLKTDTSLTYNASTNILGTSISGNAATATSATSATNATNADNIALTVSSTASAFKVPFANTTGTSSGDFALLHDSAATFTYNPSTNVLTVGTVSGALSGNATTATTATNQSGGSVNATTGDFSGRVIMDSDLYIGETAEFLPTSSTATGFNLLADGGLRVARSANLPVAVMRQTDDGGLVNFLQAGVLEGAISVAGTTVTYGGGHLGRWSQVAGIDPYDKQARPDIKRGTVMSNLDEMCDWVDPESSEAQDNEQLNKTKISDTEGDVNVAGVFQKWDDEDDVWVNDYTLAMTGDMIIRIAANVTVQKGDLLMSAGDGTAKPQGDDIVRSKTVAKVTSNNVSYTYDDGSYCVPCVLMAC